jgi:RnfABCDGE-type electron transport complex B subunit
MKTIIFTIIVSLIIAFILGLLLGLFKKIFEVKLDPKIQEIRDLLSGGNCGGCGYAGCDAFASAVVAGEAPTNGCVAGGPSCAAAIAKIMGGEAEASIPKVAILACKGDSSCAKQKGIYNGIKTCQAAQMVMNGTKACSFGCIGYGDCVNACSFNAISLNENNLPVVDYKTCVGCGKCAKVCPKNIIHLIENNAKGSYPQCSCKSENKVQIRKDCTAGCFKCGLCAKKCPENCIDLSSGLPVIDHTKCTSCGECAKACVDKVFVILEDFIK